MSILDDVKAVRRIDRGRMLTLVSALPEQCRAGWKAGLAWDIPLKWGSSDRLLVLGMGGSAIGAELAHGFLEGKIVRGMAVNRTYTVPGWVHRKTLVLACSYSGNTEETLTAVQEADRRGSRIVALTSGGKLASLAIRRGYPLLQIPQGLPPRAAVGYLAFGPLGLLVRLGWVGRRALPVRRASADLERFITSRLSLKVRTSVNPAKRIATALFGRVPILYGASGGWEGIVYRWRTQLEENAKSLAFHHLFPEATHNEISGWLQPKPVVRKKAIGLFLTDPAVHPRIRRGMQFMSEIVRRQGAPILWVEAPGHSALSRMMGLLALGDFVSVYLALLYGTDPTPVDRVEALKRYMKDE